MFLLRLYNDKNFGYFFISGLILIIAHSCLLYLTYSEGIAGSDTQFYMSEYLKLYDGLESFVKKSELGFKYYGYMIFVYISTYPFTDHDNIHSVLVRINTFFVFFCLFIILKNKVKIKNNIYDEKIVLFLIYTISIWFSLFVLRDSIIAVFITVFSFYIYGNYSKYKKIIFTPVIFLLLAFFKYELIPFILISLILVIIFSARRKENTFVGGMIFFTILVSLYSLRFIPFPEWSHIFILKLLVVNEHDVTKYNDSSVDFVSLIATNPKLVFVEIFNRAIVRIPALFLGYNPMKVMISLTPFNENQGLNFTIISYISTVMVSLIQYFMMVPLLIVIIFSKCKKFGYYEKIIYFSFSMIIIIFILYAVKFGDAQPRIIWPFALPMLCAYFYSNGLRHTRLLFWQASFLMFFIMIMYYMALPPIF